MAELTDLTRAVALRVLHTMDHQHPELAATERELLDLIDMCIDLHLAKPHVPLEDQIAELRIENEQLKIKVSDMGKQNLALMEDRDAHRRQSDDHQRALGKTLTDIQKAIDLAVRFGGSDEAHHLKWVIDQTVRILADERYDAIVAEAKKGEDGADSYDWDEGIAP